MHAYRLIACCNTSGTCCWWYIYTYESKCPMYILRIYLSIPLSIYLPIYLPIYLSVSLSSATYVYLYTVSVYRILAPCMHSSPQNTLYAFIPTPYLSLSLSPDNVRGCARVYASVCECGHRAYFRHPIDSASPPWPWVRPISLLRLSLLRLLDSNFWENSLWAWEFHPLNLWFCLSQTLWDP